MESWIDSRRKSFDRSKDPKRHIPGRCTITITICNSDDATQPHTQEMYCRIQTLSITGKDQSPNLHGRHQTVWCNKLIMKSGKRHMTTCSKYLQYPLLKFVFINYDLIILTHKSDVCQVWNGKRLMWKSAKFFAFFFFFAFIFSFENIFQMKH